MLAGGGGAVKNLPTVLKHSLFVFGVVWTLPQLKTINTTPKKIILDSILHLWQDFYILYFVAYVSIVISTSLNV